MHLPFPSSAARAAQRLSASAVVRPRRDAVGVVLLSSLLLAACGLGAGPTPGAVTLTVTREFGAQPVPARAPLNVRGEETALSLLMRNYPVTTRYGGGFVQSIDGHSGGQSGDAPLGWFFFVNGIEATHGAAATTVHRGDAIWWDLHDWSQTSTTPAVVGSFPEPFLHGIGGKRLPVRIECSEVQGEACQTVVRRMRVLGVPAGVAAFGPGSEVSETLRIAIAPWSALRGLPAAQVLTKGPRVSGVYARVAPEGGSIALLDARGQTSLTLGAGGGLLAAVRPSGQAPLWVITGVDTAGVARAARDLDAGTLRDRFAIAVEPNGTALALPRSG